MIKVLTKKEELSEFSPFWEELYSVDKTATPFQKIGYINACMDFGLGKSESLYVITIKDDPTKKWVAVFPFFLDKKGKLRFINARHTDFCSAVIHPDYSHYSLFKELSEFIIRDSRVTGLELDNMESNNKLISVLKPQFRYTIVHDMNYYSTIPIFSKDSDSDSIDAFRYVAGKQRKKLRSKKKLIDTECTFEIRRKKDGSAYPGREVEQLVGHMISEGIRVKEYFSDEMLAFWERLYDSDVLCVALLYKGGEIVTCNFMYYDERHREYIKWLMLYRENSWNMVINIKIAEYIYKNDEGATINFARGIYDYKLVNFHPDVKALFCVKIAKTKFGHIKNMLSLAVHYSKPVIKSLLGR